MAINGNHDQAQLEQNHSMVHKSGYISGLISVHSQWYQTSQLSHAIHGHTLSSLEEHNGHIASSELQASSLETSDENFDGSTTLDLPCYPSSSSFINSSPSSSSFFF